MGVLLVLLAAVLTAVVAMVAAILGCLVVRRCFLDRGRSGLLRVWPWALLCLGVLTGLATAPIVATSRAEARTGWVDLDGNGILDPMANGSYDWTDVNSTAFATSWLIGIAISCAVLGAGSWYLTRNRLARPLVP